MKERPILFSGPMVLAILAGKKCQTRRLVPARSNGCLSDAMRRYGLPGDRLWVRETWGLASMGGYLVDPTINYKADGFRRPIRPKVIRDAIAAGGKYVHRDGWRSPIHMPRWASRLTLTVTSLRVERLCSIGTIDAELEGFERFGVPGEKIRDDKSFSAREAFRRGWSAIHGDTGPRSWNANSWVWVVGFSVVKP